jgi:hypothetical protein
MSEYVYFVSLGEAEANTNVENLIVYFVYRDQTTLPVLHKYKLIKEFDSALQRWQVLQIDTVYAKTSTSLMSLETVVECEQLFVR